MPNSHTHGFIVEQSSHGLVNKGHKNHRRQTLCKRAEVNVTTLITITTHEDNYVQNKHIMDVTAILRGTAVKRFRGKNESADNLNWKV